jgi:hypothetical protein
LKLVLIIGLVLVLCGVTAVWAVVRIAPNLALSGPRPRASTEASQTPAAARSPRPGDPASVRVVWARSQIDATLDAQETALLQGDENGFLAVGDPGNGTMQTELTRRFRSLRALKVSRWLSSVATAPSEAAGPGGRTEWKATLALRYCFVVSPCDEEELRVESRWVERNGRTFLVDIDASAAGENGPRPWEVSELKVAVGKRAVVATTSRYGTQLLSLLSQAEKAATVADKFTIGGQPPDRYHVFFAGSAEWKQWYSGNRPAWAAGYAVSTGSKRIDVVLNAAETPASFLDDILRHEMSHAASLPGARHQEAANWWLVEGLAENAEMYGRAPTQYDAVSAGAVRRFIRAGKWDGTIAVPEPTADAPLWEAGARYGVAFLGVRRLIDRYGEQKVLDFFRAVVHDGDPLEAASAEAFGAPWTGVQADAASYVRKTGG